MVQIPFRLLSESQFTHLARSQTPVLSGYGSSDIHIFKKYRPGQQRGYGLWSSLANIGKRALPFLRKYIFPTVADLGRNVFNDVVQGNTDFKSSLKKHGKDSLKKVGQKILSGGRRAPGRVLSKSMKAKSRRRRMTLKRRRNIAKIMNKIGGSKRSRRRAPLKKKKMTTSRKKKIRGGIRKRSNFKNRNSASKKQKSRMMKSLFGNPQCSTSKKKRSCAKDIFS